MCKLFAYLVSSLCFITSVIDPLTLAAADANLPRLTATDVRPSFYRAGEFSIDGFATARLEALTRVTYGAGIGGNWFPFRAAGLGVEAATEDTRHSVFDTGAVKLLGRLP